KVKWLHKDIPINEFNDIAKKSLHWRRTVYKIQKQEALESIKKAMKKYAIFDGFVKEPLFEDKNLKQYEELVTTLEKLSQSIFISEQKLKNIQQLLKEKKQVIFYGPPGTSKTFVAKKFSEYFVNGKKENIEIVQFHPSYSYEDFIEGIKPRLSIEGEATGFIKQPGILKNLVDKCIKNPNENFVLIIDEINLGNISKIFGELIYLLEYRNEKVRLTYSPNEEFYIPNNLYIIGIMNSADRSIAFVDYALRRRFYFIDFYPDAENEDILKKWFIKNRIKEYYQNNVLEMMREINIEISNKLGREYQIGYSYFMHSLDYEKVKRIIDYAIIPLVEQYFFGKKESVGVIKNICGTYLIKLQDFENGKERSLSSSLESFSS
ncbi:MAG TPA: AAA family ATPase, partial [Nitrososphaeraceae archaeon]|nr:AAA family ATPase [Nitrososphaeraceae archaeon]